MKKLKYGLLLVLSMILFSVPVLAAKTYYLPSDIKVEDSREIEYKYDKHGHLISYYNKGNMDSFVWEYKYDKNGKRISGKRYCYGDLDAELTFDKNQRLKSLKDCWTNKKKEYAWTKNGYVQKAGNGLYKYYYYSDGKVKKSAYYVNGKLNTVSYYNKSGLLSKQVSKLFESTDEYEYKYGENGLVKEIRRNTTYSNGKKDTRSIYIYYSKTKTDRITYANFINGFDTCEGNALL